MGRGGEQPAATAGCLAAGTQAATGMPLGCCSLPPCSLPLTPLLASALARSRRFWQRKGDVFHLLLNMALVLDDRWAGSWELRGRRCGSYTASAALQASAAWPCLDVRLLYFWCTAGCGPRRTSAMCSCSFPWCTMLQVTARSLRPAPLGRRQLSCRGRCLLVCLGTELLRPTCTASAALAITGHRLTHAQPATPNSTQHFVAPPPPLPLSRVGVRMRASFTSEGEAAGRGLLGRLACGSAPRVKG